MTDSFVQPQPGTARLVNGDALDYYAEWPAPTAIIVDGPYGIGGFPGDLEHPDELPDWYEPHVRAWADRALPETTLWFWGVEVGWAAMHPLLERLGWEYRSLQVWNKGKGHIAGNVNGKSIRGFPVVTEVCAHYTKRVTFEGPEGESMSMKEWLRYEWQRAGIPLNRANDACGVADAATRKYLTQGPLWYFPPPEMMERLAEYANEHGDPEGRPYYSLDGEEPLTAVEWEHMRAKWNHRHGVTNVWTRPALRGSERITENGSNKSVHSNQKPLSLMRLLIESSTDPGDVVWEPFGGLCTAAVAAMRFGREAYAAEIDPDTFDVARDRIFAEMDALVQEPVRKPVRETV